MYSDCSVDSHCVVKLESDLEAEAGSYGYRADTGPAKMTAETAYESMNKKANEEKLKEGALYKVLQKAIEIAKAR